MRERAPSATAIALVMDVDWRRFFVAMLALRCYRQERFALLQKLPSPRRNFESFGNHASRIGIAVS